MILVSFSGSVLFVNGRSEKKQSYPILIKFKQFRPADNVRLGEEYLVHLEWQNKDRLSNYVGHFVLSVKYDDGGIDDSFVECYYDGLYIEPLLRGDTLEFWLPSQEFIAFESGFIEFYLFYQNSGSYTWSIAIAQ